MGHNIPHGWRSQSSLRTEVSTRLPAKCLYLLSHLADSNTLSILKVTIKIPDIRSYSFIHTFKRNETHLKRSCLLVSEKNTESTTIILSHFTLG